MNEFIDHLVEIGSVQQDVANDLRKLSIRLLVNFLIVRKIISEKDKRAVIVLLTNMRYETDGVRRNHFILQLNHLLDENLDNQFDIAGRQLEIKRKRVTSSAYFAVKVPTAEKT